MASHLDQPKAGDTVHAAPAGAELAPPSHVCVEPSADADQSRLHQRPDIQDAITVATTIAPALATVAPLAAPPVLPIATRFGGLFYLINVGIFLELYGDFTSPARPGITLPIWDFVAAVGERLVGKRLRADPVWPMLAGLAGREDGDAPGHAFELPSEWRMPAVWLEPFPSSRVWRRPRARRRRLEVPSRFDGWLDRVMADIGPRLVLALGLADRRAIGQVLIERDARVFLTDSELHVVFSLADLPIAVRLSGLDRNPGWVPAAGRRVAFEFE